MSEPDWLDAGAADVARAEMHAKAVEFAKNYLVFDHDARGRAILEHWEKTLLRKRTPVGGSLQQYAADEAVRAFIAGVVEQVRIGREEKV